MHQIQIPLGSLPIALICTSTGHVGFVQTAPFNIIIDQNLQGVSAIITPENLLVGNTEVDYNVAVPYKEMPELLQWLKQQELIHPLGE